MYSWPVIRDIVSLFSVVLQWIHGFIQSYGWSIIVLTILFRCAMLPLDIRSKVSMKKQAALQPKIAKINEKYKNDKEKAAQKTMELYKQEKASPLSGCLPALVQWPLFIAFFGALNIMAGTQIHEIYQAIINHGATAAQALIEPWLWVHNVWAPDTAFFGTGGINLMGLNSSIIPGYQAVASMAAFQGITQAQYQVVMSGLIARTSSNFNGWFLLPLLAGITSWWQTKITMPPQSATPNPATPKNPLSGKTMQYIFPLISVFFTSSSNSVFALYWITSNLVSIATFKGVDMVWKLRETKKEHEEKLRLETEAATAAEALRERETKKLSASGNKNKNTSAGPAAPTAQTDKGNPKEGNKK
jgi:YidC/Oxa1 family membrane protein insertase